MEKYIDKAAVVAEIERLQDAIKATAIDGRISKEQAEAYKVCVKLRSFVEDTLEVKEVDLDDDRKVLCDGCEEECKYSESDDFTKALAECISQAQCNVVDPMVLAETWKDELIKLAKSEEPVSDDLEEEIDNYVKRNGYDGLDSIEEIKYIAQYFTKWQKTKDDSCTSDLGDYINELSKQFQEVSFAKLSRIAVRVAKWQKEQIKEVLLSEVLPCFMHGGEADEVVAKLDEVLNKKK